ncbi:MAG: hypothetical protein NXH90_13575 [Flavobacteriaceae bacterium]|nr:hypothetical protein [Flavobacteriaceae bacterium]
MASLYLNQLSAIKNICSLIPLLAIYAWTMVLGYWSPELPTESRPKREATWYQLDGRTDGSLHLTPSTYSNWELPSDTEDPGIPFSSVSVAWTKGLYQSIDQVIVSKSIVHLHDLLEQDKADLLYPFHFFF